MVATVTGTPLNLGAYGDANSGTVSSTITVPADCDAILVVMAGLSSTVNYQSGGSVTFTKGGVDTAMTYAGNIASSTAAFFQTGLYYMVAPDTGTNKTLKWDWPSTTIFQDPAYLTRAAIVFLKGVDQTTPFRDAKGNVSGSLPIATSANVAASNGDFVVSVACGYAAVGEGSINSWTNATALLNLTVGGGDQCDLAFATTDATGAFSPSADSGTNWDGSNIAAIAFRPAAAGSPYTLTAEAGAFTLSGQAATLNVGPWNLVGVGTITSGNATTISPAIPGTPVQGDLLVAVISSRIASTTSITLPTGGEWTLVTEQKSNNILTTGSAVASGLMAYCIRGGSNPNTTFTFPTAPSIAMAAINVYRGASSTGTLNTQGSTTTAISTTSVSVAGVTTTTANALIVVGLCGGQEAAWSAVDATSPSVASGATNTTQRPTFDTWLERSDALTTTGADTSLATADAVKVAVGATGNITATASVAASHAILIGVFKPVPVSLAPYTLTAEAGSFALSGQAVVLRTALPAGAGAFALAGQPATFKRTYVMPAAAGAFNVAGQLAALRRSRVPMAAAAGAFTLAGQAAGLRATRKLAGAAGAFVLAGQLATLKRATTMPAGAGAFVLAGQDAALIESAEVTHYTMAAATGTFTLAGQAVGLRATRKLTAAAGSFALAGQTVVLNVTLPANVRTYAITGQPAGLRSVRKLVAEKGTFTTAGQPAALRATRRLAAVTRTFAVTGQAAVPRVTLPASASAFVLAGQPATLVRTFVARTLAAGGGTFTLAGVPADLFWTLTADYVMEAGTGSVLVTGKPATLVAPFGRTLVAATGAFTLSGQLAALRATRKLVAGAGAFTVTGQPVALRATRKLAAGTGAFTLTGQAAIPQVTLPAVTRAFTLSGQAAGLRAVRKLPAATGAFVVTGHSVALVKTGSYVLVAARGQFTLTGQLATLRYPRSMPAAAGSVILAGQPAALRSTRKAVVDTGAFLLTGQPVTLTAEIAQDYTMSAAPGTIVLTGQEAALTRTLSSVTVQPGRLTFGRRVSVRRW